jgi:hypothetical protein
LTITLGSHLIKLGGEFSHTEAYRHENISADGSTYSWGGSIANNGWAEYLLGRPNQFTERAGLEYRFEAFNVLNHPQFGDPSTNLSAGTFGKITTVATASTATGARVLQMGLKLIF